ncbi:MAG TPA: SpoIIE family protein phosphatase [Candidatus Limnocylindrales bacterium]|nr:SpoIIE family protein phosphatase [Candidatus Limnocylindrales bacterium]
MTLIGTLRQRVPFRGRRPVGAEETPVAALAPADAAAATGSSAAPAIEIAPSDPLFGFLQAATGVVDLDRLELESPAVRELREAGIRIVVPLVAQGELIGALYLGPRLSDQEYSSDDRKLLSTLAAQAAPAIRVAQLVREQAAEIQARERLEQEMRVATMIQQQFLPHELPKLPGWQVAAHYAPARAVGGDFYDFIALPGDRIGVVVGDVTGKGVPAALLMARTQSVLRSEAPHLASPGAVLARANEILLPEMPARMFVTCLYLVIEPATGRVTYANAGHNLPVVRGRDGVVELRATGMPLGLLPDRTYDEKEASLAPGQTVLLYSDGIDEAHAPDGEMFGLPRVRELMAIEATGSELIDHLLDSLHAFVGRDWDQEDDITLVALDRTGELEAAITARADRPVEVVAPRPMPADQVLLRLTLPGADGNERIAMDQVADAVAPLGLDPTRLERLKTAVSEAAMNAIEYGSRNDPAVPVEIEVAVAAGDLVIRITDRGLSGPLEGMEEPDLDAKLAGSQKPRGWGLFLIRHMVDAMDVATDGPVQTVTLTIHLAGGEHVETV